MCSKQVMCGAQREGPQTHLCVLHTPLHLCRAQRGGPQMHSCVLHPYPSPLLVAPEIKGKDILRAAEQQTGVVTLELEPKEAVGGALTVS